METFFINLYKDGYIYKGDRIVNWCPHCNTAVSDIEVEHEDENGKLYYIKYKIENSDKFLLIATTRPETLLGDLAVSVNPKDERYKDLVGKNVILPLVNKLIPIIEDSYVDMEYGTGVVKITPSHDPNDFEVGSRANLGQNIVIGTDAKIIAGNGKYSGMDRYEARKEIIKDLDKLGQLEKIEDISHAVGHCSRCKTIIEPLISKQWFLKMDELAKPAIEAVKTKKIKFYPERFEKTYLNWLENIRDWCISRQLYWGHRIPVYTCTKCGKIYVGINPKEKCDECCNDSFKQEEDTLDTWFSSALWPFSTMGWPEKTEDFNEFFPTDLLITGYDILFFWVIRMVFSSLYNTGEIPFKDVFLTGLVRDSEGRKMSKSLNNGIDPIEVMDKYGADALRFMLTNGMTAGNDMRFYIERVESARNFANKLWNASRFVLMHTNQDYKGELYLENLKTEDKWILGKLSLMTKEFSNHMEKYEFSMAASTIYDFTWNYFCDWYIEIIKKRLFSEDSTDKKTASECSLYVLTNILKVLSTIMPFICEEIYSFLPNKKDMLINENYPEINFDNEYSEEIFELDNLIDVITQIRNRRNELNIHPSKRSTLLIDTSDIYYNLFKNNLGILTSMSNVDSIERVKMILVTVFKLLMKTIKFIFL